MKLAPLTFAYPSKKMKCAGRWKSRLPISSPRWKTQMPHNFRPISSIPSRNKALRIVTWGWVGKRCMGMCAAEKRLPLPNVQFPDRQYGAHGLATASFDQWRQTWWFWHCLRYHQRYVLARHTPGGLASLHALKQCFILVADLLQEHGYVVIVGAVHNYEYDLYVRAGQQIMKHISVNHSLETVP